MKIFISDDDMCTTQKLNLARVQKWFELNGCSVTTDLAGADQAICMTCNGWSLLEERSYDRIQTMRHYVEHDKLIVMGCVVDAHESNVEAIHDGPTVKTRSSRPMSFEGIEKLFPEFTVSLESVPAQSEFRRVEDYRDYNPQRVFLNVAEGCAFNCTFCTHKPGLGARRSRPLSEIINQLEDRVANGTCDIVHIMGMETALWGPDVGSDFPELLEAILAVGDDFEVHVGQFQPHGLKIYGDRLTQLFCNKRVVDIQIPIQSTSKRIMKMMNRKEHSEAIATHLDTIRRSNTRVILRTDCIVGWPTESTEEREASLNFACRYFDEIAVYAIELNPDLPAWKYNKSAFSSEELGRIVSESSRYVESKGRIAHSGQQDDASMEAAEAQRKELRQQRIIATTTV